jgi:methionine-gamma-lyase
LKAIWKVVIYILAIPPSNLYLDRAMAAMEGTETANASGMGAITPTLMQLCGAGDHIVSSRTIYGGTYAFLKTSRQDFIKTTFVDIKTRCG